jgi:DASH complex subunit DAM1
MEALEAQNAAKALEVQMAAAMAADKTSVSDTDTTFSGNVTSMTSSKPNSAPKKKGTKTKLTAKEKKERSVSFLRMVTCVMPEAATHCLCNQIETERIIACLPLEFRGSDPVCYFYRVQLVIHTLINTIQGLRRNMESVIEGLMYSSNQSVKCGYLPCFLKMRFNISLTL